MQPKLISVNILEDKNCFNTYYISIPTEQKSYFFSGYVES